MSPLLVFTLFINTIHAGYIAVEEAISQPEAQARCQQLYTEDLASIHNLTQNEVVRALCESVGRSRCWIGRYCTVTTCDNMGWSNGWSWYDGSAEDWDKYASGGEDPNNRGNIIYSDNGEWDDWLASETEKFICNYFTPSPTKNPTKNPSKNPSKVPSKNPTNNPSNDPSKAPTSNPSTTPTKQPTADPTIMPSINPTLEPTNNPTVLPTLSPSDQPTASPTKQPTDRPTASPSDQPTPSPTVSNDGQVTEPESTQQTNSNGSDAADQQNVSFMDENMMLIIIAAVIGILIFCIFIVLFYRKKKKRNDKEENVSNINVENVEMEMHRVTSLSDGAGTDVPTEGLAKTNTYNNIVSDINTQNDDDSNSNDDDGGMYTVPQQQTIGGPPTVGGVDDIDNNDEDINYDGDYEYEDDEEQDELYEKVNNVTSGHV